jgi:hypothetical protein
LIYAEIYAPLEVHECVFAPEAMPDFFPRQDLAGALSKEQEEAEGLRMNLQRDARFAQLAIFSVQLKWAETKNREVLPWRSHENSGGTSGAKNSITPSRLRTAKSGV